MSLAELRERIEYEKIRRQVEEDEKRKQILDDNEQQADKIAGKAVRVHEAWSKLKNEKEAERQRKHEEKMERLRREKEIREKGTLEAYDKISEKKRLKK